MYPRVANRRGYPPRKALARKTIPADIRSLCRAYTGEAVRSLAAIMRQVDAPPGARIQAISILMDRGWGKAVQMIGTEDSEPLTIVVRQILRPADVDCAPTGTTAKLVN